MFKMNQDGNGTLICKKDLATAMDMAADCYTFDKFRYMCILSGCDYLPNIRGIGLKRSQKVWQSTQKTDTDIRLVSVTC